jgi:CheY-like chemotaxis protein
VFFCESKNIPCQVANSASEGLAAIHKEKFNLILLDLAMPEVSGIDVIESLNQEGLLKKLNLVIFTASSDHKALEKIKEMGVKDIFKKPCSVEDLANLIEKYDKSV